MNKKAILFPGQGAQYLGMGKALYENYTMIQDIYDEASDYVGFDVAKFCFEGSDETMKLTEYTQPIVLVNGYASAKLLQKKFGFHADYLSGHSLGEITALTFSGGISFQDAVTFVKLRGKYMQEAVKNGEGAMSAIIGIETSIVKQVCEESKEKGYIVECSNYNSKAQTVISGYRKAVVYAGQRMEKLGAKIVPLNVSGPFHCILMKPAVEKLEVKLHEISFHSMNVPVVSSVTGIPYLNIQDIGAMWLYQLTRPVEWTKCMQFMIQQGVTTFVDAGPSNTMQKLAYANGYGFDVISLDKDEHAFLRLQEVKSESLDSKQYKREKYLFPNKKIILGDRM